MAATTTGTVEKLPASPEVREVASTLDGRDITRGYVTAMQRLEPQDSVLRARGGGNLAIYDEVLRDEQVKMALDQRRLAVTSCDWEVEPASDAAPDKKAADALKANLEALEWDRITDQMLFGVFYGYSVGECMWMRDGAQVILDDVKVRDRRRFAFDGAQQLRLLTQTDSALGELLKPGKFWRFATGATHGDEPYGLGLAHWLYWPVFFKRNGMSLWLTFLDKFGAPTSLGKYPPNATQEERDKLLAACAAIRTDSGVILPEGMLIELLEAGRSGTADYSKLHDLMNDAIAKAVLGQVMTSEARGGQYKSEVQMSVRQDLVKADADLICMSFSRQVARWLTLWNFPDAATPRVWRVVDEGEDLNTAADRDSKLVAVGFRPTLERIEEVYGEGYEPVAQPNVEGGQPGDGGEEDEDAVPADAGRDDAQDGRAEFYDPDQPREPAGTAEGGQWTDSKVIGMHGLYAPQRAALLADKITEAWLDNENGSLFVPFTFDDERGGTGAIEYPKYGGVHMAASRYENAKKTAGRLVRVRLTDEFAESDESRFPDQDAVDAAIDSIDPATQQAQIEPAVAPIIALIEGGESYETILGRLAEQWPAMDTTELQESLSRAWFAFEAFGRLTAKASA